MNGFQAEQAVFTSLPGGPVQGYHLAARSAGIDETLARQLVRWGPSHAALCEERAVAESVNFHPLGEGYWVLSRTLCGGPEYSSRGGFQLITRMAILTDAQWEAYRFHAVSLFRRARSEGAFQLLGRFPPHLPPLQLPPPPPPAFAVFAEPAEQDRCPELLEAVRMHLRQQQRLAVVLDGRDPLKLMDQLERGLSLSQRKRLSFATGLKPTAHRPFQIHLLPTFFSELRRTAVRLNLQIIRV